MRSVEDSYARLGLSRIDIAYVHDIGRFTHSPEKNAHYMAQLQDGGFRALDRLKSSGAIKAWGIGVNEIAICHEILDLAELDCILLAGRHSLLDRTADAELLPKCQALGVSIIAGGVLNSGILATGPTDGAYFDYQPASPEIKKRVASMQEVAAAHGHSLTRAALQYPLKDPVVASMLLGTETVEKLQSNLDDFTQPIPQAAWADYARHALMG